MSELTEEAKVEIREAIRIVREDRFEKYVRDRVPPKTSTPETDPPNPGPTPPPVKESAKEEPPPENDPPASTHSKYWGEIFG